MRLLRRVAPRNDKNRIRLRIIYLVYSNYYYFFCHCETGFSQSWQSQFTSLSPRRERVRVRGIISPPPSSSPLKGEEILDQVFSLLFSVLR